MLNKKGERLVITAALNAYSTAITWGREARDIILVLIPSGITSGMTIKVIGGDLEDNLAAAQSTTNSWTYVNTKNADSDASIAGSTGLALTANTPVRLRINANQGDFDKYAVFVSAYTDGVLAGRWRGVGY
jgi:hypothetical protein